MDVALVGGAETLALDRPTKHKEPGRHELPPLESYDTVHGGGTRRVEPQEAPDSSKVGDSPKTTSGLS